MGLVESSCAWRTLDRSQNYAFFSHLVTLHFICITFAFHLHFAQPPELVYLHYISLVFRNVK